MLSELLSVFGQVFVQHRSCGLRLLFPQVGVDVHGRGGVGVAKHLLSGQDRHTGFIEDGGVTVPELVCGQVVADGLTILRPGVSVCDLRSGPPSAAAKR